jgi:Flp pilus assembly protein TadB
MMREDTRRKKKEIELVGVGEYSFLTRCNFIKKREERERREGGERKTTGAYLLPHRAFRLVLLPIVCLLCFALLWHLSFFLIITMIIIIEATRVMRVRSVQKKLRKKHKNQFVVLYNFILHRLKLPGGFHG